MMCWYLPCLFFLAYFCTYAILFSTTPKQLSSPSPQPLVEKRVPSLERYYFYSLVNESNYLTISVYLVPFLSSCHLSLLLRRNFHHLKGWLVGWLVGLGGEGGGGGEGGEGVNFCYV